MRAIWATHSVLNEFFLHRKGEGRARYRPEFIFLHARESHVDHSGGEWERDAQTGRGLRKHFFSSMRQAGRQCVCMGDAINGHHAPYQRRHTYSPGKNPLPPFLPPLDL